MAWGRLDDDFYDNPKVGELLEDPEGLAAIGFWTLKFSWAHRYTRRPGKIPGFLPRANVVLTPGIDRSQAQKLAGLLVKVGLWELRDDGWQIHDFDAYLPSERKRAAQSANAQKRWSKTVTDASGSTTDASGNTDDASQMPKVSELGMPNASHALGMGKVVVNSEGSSIAEGGAGGDKNAHRLPADFKVTPAMVAWAKENVPHVDGRLETQKFRDHWAAASGQQARKKDWIAAWRNWMRNADERLGRGSVTRLPPKQEGLLGNGFWEQQVDR